MLRPLIHRLQRVFRLPISTFELYGEIRGEQSAAAFAYYALFSIVPLITLLLSLGSFFVDSGDIESALETFVPLDPEQRTLLLTSVEKLEAVRGGVSLISVAILMWTSLRFFQALVRAVNEAWHTEPIPWWQLPLKNLVMIAVVASSLLLGIFVPAIIQGVRRAVTALDSYLAHNLPGLDLAAILAVLDWSRYLVSGLVLFYAFSLLYMLAPRRRVRFREVWLPALIVAILLQAVQVAFVSVLPHFINYSEIYGPISSLMLLLLWIYLSGQIIILGGCLCAARSSHKNPPPSSAPAGLTPSSSKN